MGMATTTTLLRWLTTTITSTRPQAAVGPTHAIASRTRSASQRCTHEKYGQVAFHLSFAPAGMVAGVAAFNRCKTAHSRREDLEQFTAIDLGHVQYCSRPSPLTLSPQSQLVARGYAGLWRRPAGFWSVNKLPQVPCEGRMALRYMTAHSRKL